MEKQEEKDFGKQQKAGEDSRGRERMREAQQRGVGAVSREMADGVG